MSFPNKKSGVIQEEGIRGSLWVLCKVFIIIYIVLYFIKNNTYCIKERIMNEKMIDIEEDTFFLTPSLKDRTRVKI